MRSTLLLAIFTATLANAAFAGYEEVRELSLDTRGIEILNIEAGAGSLKVVGVSGSSKIVVTATIYVPGSNDSKALRKIEKDMVLILERNNDSADLKAYFRNGIFGWGRMRAVHLEIRMPETMHLAIDDGTGSIEIENVRGDLFVIDGTGSLRMKDVGGNVMVRDGTGSISVSGVGGDISVKDGTGGIKIRAVEGSVTINDGVGGIDVADVGNSLIIANSGTGGVKYSNIGGSVEK